MSDVEGVTAEETTVTDSVENQTSETKVEEPTQADIKAKADDAEKSESAQEEPDDFDYKAGYEKLKAEKAELETKTKRQTAANREQQGRYEKAIADRKALEAKIAEMAKVSQEDFDTFEEYEDAKRRQDIKEELVNEKLADAEAEIDDAKAELVAQQKEEFSQARTSFQEREAAFVKENPDYHQNMESFQEFLDDLPKDEQGVIQDEGAQAGMKYILMESEMGVELLNHLGANPEKVEALYGKPPARIVKMLKSYEKSLSAKEPTPPETPTTPAPPSKLKGGASPKVNPMKMDEDAFKKKFL